MNSNSVNYIKLIHGCYVCNNTFVNPTTLRRHMRDIENIIIKDQASKFYNKLNVKYVSAVQAKKFANVVEEFACIGCNSTHETLQELKQHTLDRHLPRSHPNIEKAFNNLDADKKWILPSGKVLDDTLFNFGTYCISDHPSSSITVDTTDKALINEGVLTEAEMEHIKQFKVKSFLQKLPEKLSRYINVFNTGDANELREKLENTKAYKGNYEMSEHHDQDWVKATVHQYVRLMESGELKQNQSEAFYNAFVWSPLDTCFHDIPNVSVIRGEKCSISVKRRKNENRSIGSTGSTQREEIGYHCDLLIRENKPSHEDCQELGVGEAGIKASGTKSMQEGGVKMVKALKDILDNQLLSGASHENVAAIGVRCSGLKITIYLADRPTLYVTRIKEIKTLVFPSDVEMFGSQILPILVMFWQIKMFVRGLHSLLSSIKSIQQTDDSGDWLNYCLNSAPPTLLPATSTSTEYISRKRKVHKIRRLLKICTSY